MAFAVIVILYVCIGFLAAAGSIFISQKLFSAKAEQIVFGLFLIAIAAFYLAFTAYFGSDGAWPVETAAVIVFAAFGLLGLRLPAVLMLGYLLHGAWDLLHEIYTHGGDSPFGSRQLTELPLAYGVFCAAYDGCMAGYFYLRRQAWNAAWKSRAVSA
jgi:hypothetical protein